MRIRLSVRSATRRHNDITQRQQTRRVLPTSSRQVEAHLPPRKSEAHVRTMAHESSMRRVGRKSGSPKCWFVCAQWHRQGMHTFSGLLSLNCKSTPPLMLHDGLQKLATAGAESVSMLMTICVGASPPPIELARAAACPARFARWVGQVFFRARLLPSGTRRNSGTLSHFTALFVGVRGGCFRLFFSRYLLTLRVCGSAGR